MPSVPTQKVFGEVFFRSDGALTLTGNWRLFRGPQLVSANTDATPVATVSGVVIEELDSEASGSTYLKTFRLSCTITYPDVWDDANLSGLTASVELNHDDNPPHNGLETTELVIFQPTGGLPAYTSGGAPNAPVLDGQRATWSWVGLNPPLFRTTAGATLASIEVNWGDGTTSTIGPSSLFDATANGPVNGNGYDYTIPLGTNPTLTHVFVPQDALGNGSGLPVTLRGVDSYGRRTVPQQFLVPPHLAFTLSADADTDEFLLDTRGSYGRTGTLATRALAIVPDPQFYTNPTQYGYAVLPSLEDDADGQIFRFRLPVAKRYQVFAALNSGHTPLAVPSTAASVVGSGLLDNRFAAVGDAHSDYLNVEYPPAWATPFPTGDHLRAGENLLTWGAQTDVSSTISNGRLWGPQVQTTFTHKQKSFSALKPPQPLSGSYPWSYSAGAARLPKTDLVNPVLTWFEGGLYLSGRHWTSGTTRLYRSYDAGRTWDFMNDIWDAGYFHDHSVPLPSSGLASVALRRVQTGTNGVDGSPLYKVEMWFKRLPGLSPFDGDPAELMQPVLVATSASTSLSLSGTLSTYPFLMCEASVGLAPRLIASCNANIGNYESVSGGNALTWRAVNG